MSYSTCMYIHGWKKGRDIEFKVDNTCKIFDANFNMIPDNGYWQKTNDDYVPFSEYMKNKIMYERAQENNESLFIFCNHDGETDTEVYQSFVEFGKILSYMNPPILIEIITDAAIENKNVCIISKQYGVISIPVEVIENNKNEFKKEVFRYERLYNIKYHEEQLEKLRTCNADNQGQYSPI